MSAPSKPWDPERSLQNSTNFIRNQRNVGYQQSPILGRSAPVVPPRPMNTMSSMGYGNTYNSYMPNYSGVGGISSYGGYGSCGSYGLPYRNSMYGNYGSYGGGYGSYGGGYNGSYGMYGNGIGDDHEGRFIQFAEQNSRNTFASVESVVRAFNSLAMMLDNTFFAMTSSFRYHTFLEYITNIFLRAVLSVAENFGRLRSMFGQIWYSVNIFRFFNWVYRKMLQLLGLKVPRSVTRAAWNEAASGSALPPGGASAPGSSWPTVAFLGLLLSMPYIISKFLPKYEDKGDPTTWNSPGVRAKACFDFVATSPNELTIHTNDIITLAPPQIQEDMQLKNTGWAFAVLNGRSGVVPLNYLIISKNKPLSDRLSEDLPVPPPEDIPKTQKTHTKRVSFGETQVFENVDFDDYMKGEEKNGTVVNLDKEESCNENKATKESTR